MVGEVPSVVPIEHGVLKLHNFLPYLLTTVLPAEVVVFQDLRFGNVVLVLRQRSQPVRREQLEAVRIVQHHYVAAEIGLEVLQAEILGQDLKVLQVELQVEVLVVVVVGGTNQMKKFSDRGKSHEADQGVPFGPVVLTRHRWHGDLMA